MPQLDLAALILKDSPLPRIESVPIDWITVHHQLPPSASLTESVAVHGVRVPVILNKSGDGRYDVIDGGRRVQAARLAGIAKLDAIVHELPDYAPVLLAAPVLLNEIRSLNIPMESEYIDRLFDLGADEDLISGAIGISKAKVRAKRRVWSDLIPALRTPFASGAITAGVARACAKLLRPQQERLYTIFAETGKLSMKDVSREKAGTIAPEQGELPIEELTGWRVKARKSAFELEAAARVGAKSNADAAAFVTRLCSLLTEFGLRDTPIADNAEVPVLNDDGLAERERAFFGEDGAKLLPEWRGLIMAGDVDKALAPDLMKLSWAVQEYVLGDWRTLDDDKRSGFTKAMIRKSARACDGRGFLDNLPMASTVIPDGAPDDVVDTLTESAAMRGGNGHA